MPSLLMALSEVSACDGGDSFVEKDYSMSRVCALTSRHKWGRPSEDAATVETKTADNIVASRASLPHLLHQISPERETGITNQALPRCQSWTRFLEMPSRISGCPTYSGLAAK